MTKHYTQAVPTDLLHKLYNAGMPKIHIQSPRKRLPGGMVLIEAVDISKIPTYAYVLDWLSGFEIYPEIHAFPVDSAKEGRYTAYEAKVVDAREMYNVNVYYKVEPYEYAPDYRDMCVALNDAIEMALELLKK